MGLGLTLLVLIMYLAGSPLLDVVELKTYDMRLRAQPGTERTRNVTIVAIDEKSLAAVGRWPWSRASMGRLVDRLGQAGARVIAFDVFFSEPENRELLTQIQRLEAEQGYAGPDSPYARLRRQLGTDNAFAEAIRRNGRVVLPMVFLLTADEAGHQSTNDSTAALRNVQDQAITVIRDSGDGRLAFPMPSPHGLVVNLAPLTRAARLSGHINAIPDADGTLRWTPLVIRYGGLFFPAADVQAVRLFEARNGKPAALALHTAGYGITGLSVGDRLIATDEYGRALIHYHGRQQTYTTLSAADILTGQPPVEALRDRIVLIGATAQGLGDVRVTPYGASFPGVEIRANVIQNLIDNDFIRRPGWMVIVDVLILLGFGVLLSLALPRLGARGAALLALGLVVVYTSVAAMLFQHQHIWLNVVYPVLLSLVLFVSSTILKYLAAETDKSKIKGAFQHYVPSAVVDQIIRNIDDLRLGGEKRVVTVLFSDIRGFTSIAETLPPEELVRLLNVYLTHMTEQVFRQDGLLDKYIGDAIMAIYGAPIDNPDHARLACRTAVGMVRELHGLQAEWQAAGLPRFEIGIGINTGAMVVGNMGSDARFDYTAIGDAVNLGARIEGLNKTYGTRILISEFTFAAVRDEFPHLREIDHTRVRGRQEPVRIYELMLPESYPHMDWVADFNRAYALFRADRRDEAQALFERLRASVGDPVSGHYAERCRSPRRRAGD